jgi:hypothetical protein
MFSSMVAMMQHLQNSGCPDFGRDVETRRRAASGPGERSGKAWWGNGPTSAPCSDKADYHQGNLSSKHGRAGLRPKSSMATSRAFVVR